MQLMKMNTMKIKLRLFRTRNMIKPVGLVCLLLLSLPSMVLAETVNALQSVTHQRLSGDQYQVSFEFVNPPVQPAIFTIADPARISLTFAGVKNNLSKKSIKIGSGKIRSVNTAEAGGRTRAVISLTSMVNHKTTIDGNKVILTLSPSAVTAAQPAPVVYSGGTQSSANTTQHTFAAAGPARVTNIDFRRSSNGAGRVIMTLSDPSTPINIKQEGSKIIVDMLRATVTADQQRHLDVIDFATPVETISISGKGRGSQVIIDSHGAFDHLAYQTDNLYTIEVKPQSKFDEAMRARKEKLYTGEKLSLNFQDIEVRSVLQLIADFTSLNVVVSDSVGGSVTLRLKDVPWDQALDIILNSKGLDKRQKGNVLYIAPATEISAREQAALQAEKQNRDLAPLRTEIFNLNYADAGQMASLLKSTKGAGEGNSLLSNRGSVTIDSRTNNLLVNESDDKLEEIRDLIQRLDVPVRQVLIEARIVNATDNFTRELGISFGMGNIERNSGETIVNSFNINLPASNPAGTIGLALAKIPLGTAIDLELSAAQIESNAEIVASPRIITSNKHKARIEQGVEIPYQESTSSGATSTSFKKAVMSLEVTPQITRDDRINMELKVKRDTVGQVFNNIPSIDTREVETQIHVENGQTVVLGGIFEQSLTKAARRIPFLSDIPILGYLFRTDSTTNNRRELLIFITPKIIDEVDVLAR